MANTTVYTVVDHEYYSLLGIFSTKEKAEAFIKDEYLANAPCDPFYHDIEIKAWEIDDTTEREE